MKAKLKIILLIAPAIFLLDQFTKGLVVKSIQFGDRIPVWENFFDLVHTRNRGAAFGLLSQWQSQHRDLFFYVLTVLALLFLFYYLKELPAKWGSVAPVGLILGGAIGNFTDRLTRGSVVDFLSFHMADKAIFGVDLVWPAFNVADSAITVGVLWLLLATARKKG